MLTVVLGLHPKPEAGIVIKLIVVVVVIILSDSRIKLFHKMSFLLCFFNFQSRVCLKSNVNYSLAWSVSSLHCPMAASIMLHLTVSKMAFPEVSPYLPICFLLLSALLTIPPGKLNVTS